MRLCPVAEPGRRGVRRPGNEERHPFQAVFSEYVDLPVPTAPAPLSLFRFHTRPVDIALDAGDRERLVQRGIARRGVITEGELHSRRPRDGQGAESRFVVRAKRVVAGRRSSR